jgi:hypothetical protein
VTSAFSSSISGKEMSTVNMGALVYDVGMEEDPATKDVAVGHADGRSITAEFHFENQIFTLCSLPSQVLRPRQRHVRAQETDNVAGRVAKLGLLEAGK